MEKLFQMKVSKEDMPVQGCYQWQIREEILIQVNFL